MNSLLILRHAKSSWGTAGLSDHERPLNQRGRRDAPRVGKLLVELDLAPDAILSSTAERALATAREVAEHCGFQGQIDEWRELYLATPETYITVARGLDESIGKALLIGHNPGLEMLVEALTGQSERMTTAALALVEFDTNDWRKIGAGRGRLAGLWRPKELK